MLITTKYKYVLLINEFSHRFFSSEDEKKNITINTNSSTKDQTNDPSLYKPSVSSQDGSAESQKSNFLNGPAVSDNPVTTSDAFGTEDNDSAKDVETKNTSKDKKGFGSNESQPSVLSENKDVGGSDQGKSSSQKMSTEQSAAQAPSPDEGNGSDDGSKGDKKLVSTYLSDGFISAEVIQILSLEAESLELSKDADVIFKNYCNLKNVYILPDDQLGHFKDKQNAAIVKSMDGELYIHWENWKDLTHAFVSANMYVAKHITPLDPSYLRNLNRHVIAKEKLVSSPIWSLAPIKGSTIAMILYGTAVGGADLLPFMVSKYSKMELKIVYDAAMTKSNTATLSLNGQEGSSVYVEEDISIKSFNPANVTFKKPDSGRSMFFSDSLNSSMSQLMILKTSSEIETTQTSTTERVTMINKGKTGTSSDFHEAFLSVAVVNEDFVFHLTDKSVLDMLISLFFISDMKLSKPDIQIIINYVCTVLFRFVQQSMYVKTGIRISKADMNISLSRNPNAVTQSQLFDIFSKFINDGHIVPISPMHYHYFENENFDQNKWLPFLFWAAIGNAHINDELWHFLPSIDRESKNNFRLIARNKELLTTEYYQSERCLPYQRKMKSGIDFDSFIRELFIRSLIVGDIPEYFPFLTRSQWKGAGTNSPNIAAPTLHRICKFGLVDHLNVIEKYVEMITMRDVLPPSYVRKLTRLTESLPGAFVRFSPNDDGDN